MTRIPKPLDIAPEEWSSEFDTLQRQIGAWREAKGFKTPQMQNDPDAMLGKLMLVVTEVAEAAEACRHADFDNFTEEIADTAIRLFDIADTGGFSLMAAVHRKMDINADRPYRHGKKTTL